VSSFLEGHIWIACLPFVIIGVVSHAATNMPQMGTLMSAIKFVFRALWAWRAISFLCSLVFAGAISAMYSNDYISATIMFAVGMILLCTRTATAKETVEQHNPILIGTIIVVFGGMLLVLLIWNRSVHTRLEASGRSQYRQNVKISKPPLVPSAPPVSSESSAATKVKARALDQKQTVKYRAMEFDKKWTKWITSKRAESPGTYEGLNTFLDVMNKTYPIKFSIATDKLVAQLKACGADTTQLDEDIRNIKAGTNMPNYFFDLGPNMSEAARDIPGGQPECGTGGSPGGGFREKDTGIYLLKIGRSAQGLFEDQLAKGPQSVGNWFGIDPFQIYVLKGHFYLDATLFLGSSVPAVKIKRNEIETTEPFGIDHNFTSNAIEVVDTNTGRPIPVFQMIFESERQITVNGVFFSQDRRSAIVVTPKGTDRFDFDPAGQKKIVVPLKPLFKYPSWEHLHELADR